MILTFTGNKETIDKLTTKEIRELLNSNINNKGKLITEYLKRIQVDIKSYFGIKDKIRELSNFD